MSSPRRAASLGSLAAAALIAAALVGCTTNSDEESAAGNATGSATVPATGSAQPTDSAPFGPGCAGVPSSGPASLAAIAELPVAAAAAQNPALSTLVTAVTAAGLVDTLNNAASITVFAPTNDAFAKIPQETLSQVLADKKALTNILTYHVVQQRRTPAELAMGSLPTLQGGTISTAKVGDTYTANEARIVCGNVQTRNATVYLVDTVLMPKS